MNKFMIFSNPEKFRHYSMSDVSLTKQLIDEIDGKYIWINKEGVKLDLRRLSTDYLISIYRFCLKQHITRPNWRKDKLETVCEILIERGQNGFKQ